MLRTGQKFLVPRDVEVALWSTQQTRSIVWLAFGAYECVWVWQTSWGETIATLTSERMRGTTVSIIVGTHWGHTPGRTIMTPIPFAVGDNVIETRTGKQYIVSHVFLHKDHCEHHYKFEQEVSTYPFENLRWHHELKRVEHVSIQLVPSEEEIPAIDAMIDAILEKRT